jgi:hypothetical protein
MGWFDRMCRNTGLMLHHIAKPIRDEKQQTQKREVARHTKEKRLDEKTILRRTTVDEIEVRRDAQDV